MRSRWRPIICLDSRLQLICKKKFCGFSMGNNQYWAGRVYDLCVYYMTGTPKGSTESGFMEKPGTCMCEYEMLRRELAICTNISLLFLVRLILNPF